MSISKVEDRRGHNINDENINSQLNIHSRVNSLEITDIRKNHDHLVINPARGSWAVLDDNSLSVFKSMKNVILADLQKKSKIKMEELIKFSRDLYNYGLITVDDQVKVNPITQDLSFSMLVLKLTNKCNLLCTYCYNEGLDATDEGISMATAFNSIDSSLDACNEGVVIVLHGGEPLLQFKRLQEIVEYGEKQSREYSKKIIFSLQTNATLLNRTNVEYIKEHEIGLGISFDGPAVINDATRVYRNGMPSSEKIMRGIQLIKDYALPVNIITVVTKFNDKNLAEIVLYLQDMGCSSVQFSYFFGQGLGATAIEMAPNPEYVVYSLKEILKKIVTKEISTIEVNEIMSKIDSILLHNKRDICHRSPCGAGKDMMTIFPSGKIYACDCLVHPDFELGNIHDISLREAAKSKKLNVLNNRIVENLLPCSTCVMKRICGGTMTCRAFWNRKNVKAIDSSECFVNQSIIEDIMWHLAESPAVADYYNRFKKRKIVKPTYYG